MSDTSNEVTDIYVETQHKIIDNLSGGPIIRSSDTDKVHYFNGYYIAGRKISDRYIHERLSSYLPLSEYLGINAITKKLETVMKNGDVVTLTYSIKDEGGNFLKQINVYFDLKRYNKNYEIFYIHTFVVTILVALIVLLSVLKLLRKGSKVISQAIEGVDRVAKGDYNFRIDETRYSMILGK